MPTQAYDVVELLLSANAEGSEPPKEFRVLGKGLTATTKGPLLFDAKAAEEVMKTFAESGRDLLPFDVGHGMLNPFGSSDGHKAVGWFRPEVRNGELFASDIEWTAYGATALKAREFRFFSPALHRDFESHRVKALINIALTNIPATLGQKPLVAHQVGSAESQRGTQMLEEIIKVSGVRTEAELLSWFAANKQQWDSLVALSGKATNMEVIEEFKRLKNVDVEAVKLAQRVAELEGATKKRELDDVIAALSTQGKLAPSLHDWARATQSPDSLKMFALGAPAHAANGPTQPPTGTVVTLSAEEREVVKQLGLTTAVYLAEKKLIAEEEAS